MKTCPKCLKELKPIKAETDDPNDVVYKVECCGVKMFGSSVEAVCDNLIGYYRGNPTPEN